MTFVTSSRVARSARPSLLKTVAHHLEAWRQRRALARLDDSRLEDLGLTREQVRAESKRGFWDAPQTWRC
jgi:uncharacterized protein YjiS (DUF1127 family)